MYHSFKLIISMLILPLLGWSQAANINTFERVITGTIGHDYIANDVKPTSDGGYILTGQAGKAGSTDAILLKADRFGRVSWIRFFGGISDEAGMAVIESQNEFLLAGYTSSFGKGGEDLLLIKTDLTGKVLWSMAYGLGDDERALGVKAIDANSFLVTGYTRSAGSGKEDMFLLNINDSAKVNWACTYGGVAYDAANSIAVTLTGDYLVAGTTRSFGAGQDDLFLVKTNDRGVLIEARTYGGVAPDQGVAILHAPIKGQYIFGGTTTTSQGHGSSDGYLVHLDANLKLLDAYFIGSASSETITGIVKYPDGLILAGHISKTYINPADALLVKTNTAGNVVWSHTYGGAQTNECTFALTATSDGGYLVAGSNDRYGSEGMHYLKTAGDGSGCSGSIQGNTGSKSGKSYSGSSKGSPSMGGFGGGATTIDPGIITSVNHFNEHVGCNNPVLTDCGCGPLDPGQ